MTFHGSRGGFRGGDSRGLLKPARALGRPRAQLAVARVPPMPFQHAHADWTGTVCGSQSYLLVASPENPPIFLLAVFITFSKSIAYFKLKQMTVSRLINTCIFAF